MKFLLKDINHECSTCWSGYIYLSSTRPGGEISVVHNDDFYSSQIYFDGSWRSVSWQLGVGSSK